MLEKNVKVKNSDRRQSVVQIFYIVLCCLLFLKGMPATVFAADTYQVSVNGVAVDDTNAADVLGDGTVSYDSATNTLFLENAALQSIQNNTGNLFTISVTGQNSVTRVSDSAPTKIIDSNSALIINGSGTLEISGISGNDFAQCVSANGAVTVDGVQMKMVNAYDAGIASTGDITVLNHALVTGNVGNMFRALNGKLTIENSTIKAPDGMGKITGFNAIWVGDLEITDSLMEIDAQSQAVVANKDIVITRSEVMVYSRGSTEEIGLWAFGNIIITDSEVKAGSQNYMAVYAGGDLMISGGSIEAVTSHATASALQSAGSIYITGPVTVSTSTIKGMACKAENDIVIKTSLTASDSKMYEVYAGDTLAALEVSGCFKANTDVTTDIGTSACFRIEEHPAHVYSQETVKEEAFISAADCTNAAVYFKSCICGLVSTNSADIFATGTPAGHNTVHHEAVEPNCSAVGNVEYWECKSCNKYFSNEAATTEVKLENTVIDKAPDVHIAVDNTWSFDKDTHWNACVCGLVLNSSGHAYTWVIDREATEQASGLKHEECSVCGYAKPAVEIPASGTTTEPTNPEEPTNPNEPTNPQEPTKPEEPTSPNEPTNPEEPTSPQKPTDAEEQDEPSYEEMTDSAVSPRTGDTAKTKFWLVMSFIAGFGVVSTVFLDKKKKVR